MEIPQYTQASPTPQTVQGVVPTASTYPRDERTSSLGPGANALATGLTTLAGGLQEKQDALQRSNDQQEMTRAMLQVSAAHASLQQQLTQDATGILQGNSMGPPQDYDGLVPRYAKQATDMAQDAVQQYKSPKAQQYVLTQMAHLRDNVLLPKTMLIEAEARQQMAEYNINGTVANLQQVVGNDPSQFDMARAQAQDGIAQSGMPMAKQQIALAHANATLSMAATFSHVRDHPEVYAEQTKRRGGGPLPLAAQPGLQGVVQGMGIGSEGSGTQTFPYVPPAPVEGTPLAPPPEVLQQMSALQKKGVAVRWDAQTGLQTGEAATNYQAPTPVAPAPGPVPDTTVTQPSDAEIQASNSAWKYLTPQEQQSMRTRATAALNQQGAVKLSAAKEYVNQANTAALNYSPDPAPKDHAWFMENFGADTREEQKYNNLQVGAHIAQRMVLNPEADNSALVDKLRPVGIGQPGQFEAFNMIVALNAGQVNTARKAAGVDLHNDMQGQLQKALDFTDPGPTLPMERFTKAGAGADEYSAYLKDLDVWRTMAAGRGMSGDLLQGYKDSQAVTDATPNAEAVAQAARHGMAIKVANAITQDRANDSAGFVLKTNQDVRALYDAAQKSGDPKDLAVAMEANKAEQMRLNNGSYSLTTVADRAAIASAVTAPVRGDGSADNTWIRYGNLQKQYGANFNEVMTEYQKHAPAGSKVPSGMRAMLMLDDGTNRNASTMAQIALNEHVSNEAMHAGIDGKQVNAIKAAAQGVLGPLFSSMLPGEVNAGVQKDLVDTVEKLAFSKAKVSPSASADQLVNDAAAPFLRMNTVYHNPGSPYTAMIPANANPDTVWEGAQQMLNRTGSMALQIPPDNSGFNTKFENADDYARHVAASGMWMRNDDGTGLALYTRDALGNPRPVRAVGGKRVQFSFEALRESAIEARQRYKASAPTTTTPVLGD